MESVNVKEIKELLAGLAVVAVAGKKIAADGKVGVDDLAPLIEAAKQFNTVLEGVKDLGEVDFKKLTIDEVQLVLAEFALAVAKVKAA